MFTIFICIDFYVKDDYTKCMQYPPWYSYVKDESTKWLRYVILHLLNHMSNMIFLCPGWIYGKYAISNIILLCPGWIYEMFTIWIYTCLWLCPTWVSYVKDESTKWLLYVILHLFNLMSNMIFLCQGWIYKMYHMSNMIFLCPWWIYGKYAISNIILLCLGWIYQIFTIGIYMCLCLCPTWVSYVKDESTKW